ncbi:MAG: ATP-binding protein [Balneolaceae bacterium]
MKSYYPRILEETVRKSLTQNPVTAVLGPRQCGKSTLVKKITEDRKDVLYLDLERPSDLMKLEDPEWFLQSQSGKLVCLDEIQKKPELFPVLRSLIDEDRRPGAFLILGSASRDLIRQSSESLAGRISYKKLSPFLWEEIQSEMAIEQYLNLGGFPRSVLAGSNEASYEWRVDFISTFLERDLLQFAGFSSSTMRRLWQMLAHSNGQILNLSKIGESLGVSHTTVRNYVDLLEGTFMVTQLGPWSGNTLKRLVKTPKVYLTDTGIVAALLQLQNFEQIAGHPVFGSLWEAAVLLNVRERFPDVDFSYYQSSHGHEIDLLLTHQNLTIAIECKATVAPSLTEGFYKAAADVKPDRVFIASPVDHSYSMKKNIEVVSISSLIRHLQEFVF